ncbi:MAG: DUF4345 domain-containing protein [Myxococcales bacterium]|nr:MAG: DUF4345 domain-containing protein [Myxococcales bacterium]
MEMALVGALACFSLGAGVAEVFSPARIRKYFTDAPRNALKTNEFRAVYGGFGIALAVGLAWTTSSRGEVGGALAGSSGDPRIAVVALRSLGAGRYPIGSSWCFSLPDDSVGSFRFRKDR